MFLYIPGTPGCTLVFPGAPRVYTLWHSSAVGPVVKESVYTMCSRSGCEGKFVYDELCYLMSPFRCWRRVWSHYRLHLLRLFGAHWTMQTCTVISVYNLVDGIDNVNCIRLEHVWVCINYTLHHTCSCIFRGRLGVHWCFPVPLRGTLLCIARCIADVCDHILRFMCTCCQWNLTMCTSNAGFMIIFRWWLVYMELTMWTKHC